MFWSRSKKINFHYTLLTLGLLYLDHFSNGYQFIEYSCFTIGVLMLNACLTMRASEAYSHKDKGWEKFIDKHKF